MIRHRFLNDGRTPIPMGATAEYTCACGKRGTYEAIERHIEEKELERRIAETGGGGEVEAAPTAPYGQVIEDEFGGGNTMANYIPIEPRKPAPTGESLPLERPGTPEPLPPPPVALTAAECPRCGAGMQIANLPEICAWSCGHWIEKHPRSIAELFQDMLRFAFQAGATATTAGESFETWYQREVLR